MLHKFTDIETEEKNLIVIKTESDNSNSYNALEKDESE